MSAGEFEQPCPMCGGLVTSEDFECPHCGEELQRRVPEPRPDFDRKLLQRFHSEARALAGFWIFVGLLVGLAGFAMIYSGIRQMMFYDSRTLIVLFGTAFLASGVAFLWCGVKSAMKDIRAVRIGLQLTYLSVLLNLAILNIPGVLFLVLVILQSRRVLRNGKLLQEAGWLPGGSH